VGTIFDREHEPPGSDIADVAYRTVQSIVGLAPGGSAAARLLELIVVPPATRRMKEWMEDVAASLRLLETERAVNLEELSKNPAFIDAVLTATPAAIRTSQARKRAALRNAVLNSALKGAPDLAIQQIFISITDRFTDRHLALLKLFQDASKWRARSGASLPQRSNATPILRDAFPDAGSNEALYELLWTDLYANRLVKLPKLENGLEGDASTIKRTTDLGNQYLAFIESPLTE
jgi:hypothetical protein